MSKVMFKSVQKRSLYKMGITGIICGLMVSLLFATGLVNAETPITDNDAFKMETVFQPSTLVANQMITAKVVATNISSVSYTGTKSVLVIVGLYDSNNTMVNVSYISKGVPYQGTETLSAGFKLPADIRGCSARAFVWDGTDMSTSNMIPLSNVVQVSDVTVAPTPTVIQSTPTRTPVPSPTVTPTRTPVPTITSTPTVWPTVTPTVNQNISDRYYKGISVSEMKSKATSMSKQDVKALLIGQVDEHWSLISSKFGFTTKEKAYAFFEGMATRESTLNSGLETGGGSAHSYGPLQAAETAYANADPSYMPEKDVPEMTQYDFTPENFFDAGISVHMGIRHLIHFANLAQAAGFSSVECLRHALLGYNTGWVTGSSEDWVKQYSDESGAMAGWYLKNGHLRDDQWTWTGSSSVDRSSPWGWY